MIERRLHRRIEVEFWASLKHPLLGSVTGDIQEMSTSGFSLTLDEQMNFRVMMELEVCIHGQGWDESLPTLPVQVVRIEDREIALRFLDSCEEFWVSQIEEEFQLPYTDSILYDDGDDYMPRF
jgi:hypothetical protein